MSSCFKVVSIFIIVLTVIFSLASCSNNSSTPTAVAIPTATPTVRPTATPKPTTEPTATPEPLPEVIAMLNEYYVAHESEDDYKIKKAAGKGYISGEYQIELVADEVPDSNGTAIVTVKAGKKSFEIDFSYSLFMGKKICSPALIKAVTIATVKAIGEIQGIEDTHEAINAVISSYDDSQYTTVNYIGEYAIVFQPKDTYATILSAIYMGEYHESVLLSEYSEGTYSDLSIKLNEGSKYHISGKVISYENGKYTNSYYTYECKLVTVEYDNGNTITIAQFPDMVPINFEVGNEYDFYGTTMFDKSGNLLFYLRYAD